MLSAKHLISSCSYSDTISKYNKQLDGKIKDHTYAIGLPYDDLTGLIDTMANGSEWLNLTLNETLTAIGYPRVDPLSERFPQTLWFAFLAGMGMLINSLPISLTILTELRNNKVNIIVANLASADALAAGSFAIGQALYVVYWGQLHIVGCQFLAFFGYFTCYAEYLLSPVLAINRYISLYHNEKYNQIYTGRNIALMTAGCWSLSLVAPSIFWYGGKMGKNAPKKSHQQYTTVSNIL